jgi:hypothetical protein
MRVHVDREEFTRNLQLDGPKRFPGWNQDQAPKEGGGSVVRMSSSGCHRLSDQSTAEEDFSGEAVPQEVVYRYRGGYSAGGTPSHSRCQREPFPELNLDPVPGADFVQYGQGRCAGGVHGNLFGQPAMVSQDCRDFDPGLGDEGRRYFVSRPIQGQAQNVETASQISNGAGCEGFTPMGLAHAFILRIGSSLNDSRVVTWSRQE